MKETIILFDLDGTLIDSTDAILESFAAAYAAFGQSVPPKEAITARIGEPLETMFVTLGVRSEHVAAYAEAYRKHYRSIHLAKTTLLPGVKEAIPSAAGQAHLGIVTTKTTRYAIELMEHFGLMTSFGICIGQDDVRHPKPHPEPIRKALVTLPSVTGGRYMVGDTCLDMDAAHAANIGGMGVLCGYGSQDTLGQCADRLFKNAPEAIIHILKG